MKRIVYLSTIFLALFFSCSFVSCSDDDEATSIVPKELYGTWYASKSNREVTLILKEDGTGEFVYSSLAYYRFAEFTYKYDGNMIICDGLIAGEDGEVNVFEQQFKYVYPCLYPIGMYSEYELKKH